MIEKRRKEKEFSSSNIISAEYLGKEEMTKPTKC